MMKKATLVLCPVYNERGFLEEFYGKLRARYDGDALFVDDGSRDGSERILERLRDRRTFLLRHPARIGYGAALRDGFETAVAKRYEKIVTVDVDLQHDPGEIAAFRRMLEEHEVVLGSRYAHGTAQACAPPKRLAINRYTAGLIRELFSITCTDPFCGFRGYRSSFLRKARLSEDGYGLGLEILLEMIRTETPFVEIPVEAIYVDHQREFLDGLDDPRLRLLYYLGVIGRKRKGMDS
jgi:dolichol-phosphate mannosyltransferase